jgi:hypothetical protein
MILSRHQNAGQIHELPTADKSYEYVTKLKFLGTTATNKNRIHEEIKSRLNSGNALSYIKVHKIIILPVILYEYETWSLSH